MYRNVNNQEEAIAFLVTLVLFLASIVVIWALLG
jgi:hypothetical protein